MRHIASWEGISTSERDQLNKKIKERNMNMRRIENMNMNMGIPPPSTGGIMLIGTCKTPQ